MGAWEKDGASDLREGEGVWESSDLWEMRRAATRAARTLSGAAWEMDGRLAFGEGGGVWGFIVRGGR